MEKRGLTTSEAKKQIEKYGKNELKDNSKVSTIKILFRQIKGNFIIYLLLCAMLISFFVGKNITAYVISGIIVLVISVGFYQEFRAEKAVKALKNMLVPVSIVIRDGKEQEINSTLLAVGDVIILRNGEKIPADCIIIEQKNLMVNEAVLTGESGEISKTSAKDENNFKEENVIYMGSYIVNGKCTAKIIHTGMNTKFGKIANLISTTEKEFPLQEKINKLAKFMAIFAISFSIITGLFMLYQASNNPDFSKEILFNILIVVIALSVSAFPEGMPVVLITTLASGAYKMSKQNAIVNRMSIIETLGETTVICSDKTGTITKGEMTVKKIYSDGRIIDIGGAGYNAHGDITFKGKKIEVLKDKNLPILIKAGVLCNDSIINRIGDDLEYSIIGSPTEAAIKILGTKAGIFSEDIKSQRVEEIPFSSERKIMSILSSENKEYFVYSKGAPEYILKKCTHIKKQDGIYHLSEREKTKLIKLNEEMALESFRGLAIAYKKGEKVKGNNINKIEENLVFLGILFLEDPPRSEVKESLILCEKAGISVKMITGDNKNTAIAISKQIGLTKNLKVMEGDEIDRLSDEELSKIIGGINIFARVKPEHKLRIVKALKANGEIVTMTGDGVNDAPALKEAHIGVAMGKNGTDVSRAVADLTLKDDNFASIVSAIKEGRTILNNIRKFTTYQLSCNYTELSIIFIGVLLSPILGWQVPLLLALQILFMNIVTDNLPAITLGLNPTSKDIMEDKPRKNSAILNKNLIYALIFTGTIMTSMVLFTFFLSSNILNEDITHSRTIALISLIMLEIAGAFEYRSFRKGVLTRNPFVNKQLVLASILSLLATIAIIYTPLNKTFEVTPLGWWEWIVAISGSILLIIIFDIVKFLNKKKKFWSDN